MEIFKAIIELVDKIIWPVTLLTIFLCLRSSLKKVIDIIPNLLKERGGKIETPWGSVDLSKEEVVISSEEEDLKEDREVK